MTKEHIEGVLKEYGIINKALANRLLKEYIADRNDTVTYSEFILGKIRDIVDECEDVQRDQAAESQTRQRAYVDAYIDIKTWISDSEE